jgi:hypothetical protein
MADMVHRESVKIKIDIDQVMDFNRRATMRKMTGGGGDNKTMKAGQKI